MFREQKQKLKIKVFKSCYYKFENDTLLITEAKYPMLAGAEMQIMKQQQQQQSPTSLLMNARMLLKLQYL